MATLNDLKAFMEHCCFQMKTLNYNYYMQKIFKYNWLSMCIQSA